MNELGVVQQGCGVLRVGLCGAARQLSRRILADVSTDPAAALANRIGTDKVSAETVDGTDAEAVKSLVKRRDMVVAAMPRRLDKTVMEVAAVIGTNYVDFGMPLDSMGPELERLAELCTDAGIAASVRMGSEPGISDVLAMHAARKLDRRHDPKAVKEFVPLAKADGLTVSTALRHKSTKTTERYCARLRTGKASTSAVLGRWSILVVTS